MLLSEEKLLALSLFLSLAGILLLYTLSSGMKPLEKELGLLSGEDSGKLVLVKGSVRSYRTTGTLASFSLCGSSCVNVVDFSRNRMQSLHAGDFIAVAGKVGEFNGKLQVTAESIELIKPNSPP